MQVSASEAVAYGGSVTSVATLNTIAIYIGIATAVLTFGLNAYYARKKRSEEAEEHKARMLDLNAQLERDNTPKGGRITPLSAATEKEGA